MRQIINFIVVANCLIYWPTGPPFVIVNYQVQQPPMAPNFLHDFQQFLIVGSHIDIGNQIKVNCNSNNNRNHGQYRDIAQRMAIDDILKSLQQATTKTSLGWHKEP